MVKKEHSSIQSYVTNLNEKVYCIYGLPPEVVAVLFAYVSRSPASFRDNLIKLIDEGSLDMHQPISRTTGQDDIWSAAREKSQAFHQKWVVNYGHASVAEHAILQFAIEDVSILASKVIEDSRLASFTEKSTRYQVFDADRFYFPDTIMQSTYRQELKNTVSYLFKEYQEFYPAVENYIKQQSKEELTKGALKSQVCDVIRYLLPAGTLTSLAATMNAREAAHTIVKLRSHPLKEMQAIGDAMAKEGAKITPTLLKYTEKQEYIQKTMQDKHPEILPLMNCSKEDHPSNGVVLVDYPEDAQEKILAALLFRYSQTSYQEAYQRAKHLPSDQCKKILQYFLQDKGPHLSGLRELEHLYYTMEIIMDYGAFRDVQRHRMTTQSNQPLTNHLGYEIPQLILDLGGEIEERYHSCMERASTTFDLLKQDFPDEAQYILPLAFRKRFLITWNFREIEYFLRLRTKPTGHISYRRIGYQIYEAIKQVHPLLAEYLQIDYKEE